MTNLLIETETEESVEGRVVHVGARPIPFTRFLQMNADCWMELVDGIVVEKAMVQLDHERCSRWLYQVMGLYVQRRALGEMLSSRIMVRIDAFGGRMPDLLFVRQERAAILQQKAVYGAPDLIIEIVSAHDRPSDLRALEADYFRLGVPELVFVDLRRQEIRLLARGEEGYQETVVTSGPVGFASLPELTLQAEWILREPRPDEFDTLRSLLSES